MLHQTNFKEAWTRHWVLNKDIKFQDNNIQILQEGLTPPLQSQTSLPPLESNFHENCVPEDIDNYESESSSSSIIPRVTSGPSGRKKYVPSSTNSSNNQNEMVFNKELVQTSCQTPNDNNTSRNLVSTYIQKTLDKQKKKRTLCKFCHIYVTNFERHLTRHHVEEKEVQDFLSFPKNTKEGKQVRRNILALMRYEVDFQEFVQNNEYDPNKLPCAHCKRIIAVKYLRRHFKKCIVKPINETGRTVRHRAASQTLVACASEHANITATLRVRKEVFSRMASDEIGFLARKDRLIRHYGEFYLKKHKRAQISLSCSNKMRECSRLLIEMRRRISKPEFSFFEMLNPSLFDHVILSAKAISGYDDDQKNYKAPSLALHLGTTLQHICELTINLLLKQSSEFKCENLEERLKEVKRFRFLVQSQWNNEISSLALKDLAEKKWNKPVMLPLTENIIKFRNYISEVAEKNMAVLKNDNSDKKAFKGLVDASLSFTILFNRRRIGDVQYVEIDSYLKTFNANNQTEYLESLTESEKALTSSYKRVVAGGKGSRAIIILFPPNIQQYINLLLEIRQKTEMVPTENRYLFAYPGVTNHWVRGDLILRKFAKSCNIKNPEIMTSNRLRKQIATLMQLLNLDKGDYTQFAKFMGHTERTHQEFYEITQDAYQTAKIAKILNLFDKGEGATYRNTELANIDIDPNNIEAESDSGNEEDLNEHHTNDESLISDTKSNNNNTSDKKIVKEPKTSNRIKWTAKQKKLVLAYFKKHIKQKKAPKKEECEKFVSQHKEVLGDMHWVRVKTLVYNTYTISSKNK